MVKRSRGQRSKSRHIMRKKPRDRGFSSLTPVLQEFKEGDVVGVDIDASVHGGMPHARFQGYTGKIEGRQGNAYVVGINIGKKHKTLIVRSEHLRRIQ